MIDADVVKEKLAELNAARENLITEANNQLQQLAGAIQVLELLLAENEPPTEPSENIEYLE